MKDDYLVVRFGINKSGPSAYEFIPVGFNIGVIDKENRVFVSLDGKLLVGASRFYTNMDKFDEFYAFPIEIDKLIEKDLDKDMDYLVQEYFKTIREYTHLCCLYKSNEKSLPMYQFCSLKTNSLENPIYNDWDLPFSSEDLKSVDTLVFNRVDIVDSLKRRVIGQDKQIEEFVSAVVSNQKYGHYEGLKKNIMIIGPTGVGKTEMCNSLARILDVPIVKKDATKYTTSGYVGLNVLDILKDLYIESGCNLEKAQRGIIMMDEFDKLGSIHDNNSKVRTEAVQHELLGLLGNATYDIKVSDLTVTMDTSKITFVLSGAFQSVFDGLKSKNSKQPLGFETSKKEAEEIILRREDLSNKGGIEKELLRRIPVIIQMNNLSKEDLERILSTSEISNLRIWSEALLREDKIKLCWNNSVLSELAEEAYLIGGGASGLQAVVSRSLQNLLDNVLDGNISNCEVSLEDGISKDSSRYKVKKKGVKKNELSEVNG